MRIILAKNKNVDALDKLNQFLSDKQFIKVRYIEDLNTKIYYIGLFSKKDLFFCT